MTVGGDRQTISHVPELDGLRAIAVLLVIESHAGIHNDGAGTLGVTLFFVLSGYLITSILLTEHESTEGVNLKQFYARRARRLLPALGLFLTVIAIVNALTGRDQLPAITTALYVNDFARAAGMTMDLLPHMWSLSLEEQFYILWPLAIPALIRNRRAVTTLVAGIAVASMTWRCVLWAGGDTPLHRVAFAPDTRVDALLIGCLLALASPRARKLLTLAAPAGALVMALTILTDAWGIYLITPAAIGSAAVIAWATNGQPGLVHKALATRPLVYVGRISYGMYLWHYPVAILFRQEQAWAQLVVVFGGTVLIATVSWFLVERRFLRRRKGAPSAQTFLEGERRASVAVPVP